MEYNLDIANQVLIFAILAISLNLLMGYAGQISIAHAAIAGVGGYTMAKLATTAGFGFVPAVAFGVAAAGAAGVVLSLPALRLTVQHLILLTLAASVVMVTLARSVKDLGGAYGIIGVPRASFLGVDFNLPSDYFWLFLGLTILVFLSYWRIASSPLGRVLKAIREDEVAARALGKNVFFYKVQTFGVASAMAGLAGSLLAAYSQLVAPSQFDTTQSMLIVTMVIFGGMGNLAGPILGAAAVVVSGPLMEKNLDIGADKAALWRLVIYGAALVVLMRLRPGGILPEHASFPRPLLQAKDRLVSIWQRPTATSIHDNESPPADPSLPVHSPGEGPSNPSRSGNPAPPDGQRANEPGVLEAQGLKKSFGGIAAVDGVDFVLPERRITGLVGPNGAGKTTLFNMLTGMIPPDEGSIQLRHKKIRSKTPDAIARMGMARSFQDVRLFKAMTVLDNVTLANNENAGERLLDLFLRPWEVRRAERRAKGRAIEFLSFVGMADKANWLAGGLSYAEQKLVAIARLLATGADVLLLDEPTSGVDPQWVENVAGVIRALPEVGKTVCIVEHSLHALGLMVDHCYFMEYGRITAEGSLSDLMNEPRLVKAYFGD